MNQLFQSPDIIELKWYLSSYTWLISLNIMTSMYDETNCFFWLSTVLLWICTTFSLVVCPCGRHLAGFHFLVFDLWNYHPTPCYRWLKTLGVFPTWHICSLRVFTLFVVLLFPLGGAYDVPILVFPFCIGLVLSLYKITNGMPGSWTDTLLCDAGARGASLTCCTTLPLSIIWFLSWELKPLLSSFYKKYSE